MTTKKNEFRVPTLPLILAVTLGLFSLQGCGEEEAVERLAANPSIERVIPANIVPGETILVTGKNLGRFGTIEIDSGTALLESWSEYQISIRIGDGTPPGKRTIQLKSGAPMISSITVEVEAPPPVLQALEPRSVVVGEIVTLIGSGFGKPGSDWKLMVFGNEIQEVKPRTETAIQFVVPRPKSGKRVWLQKGETQTQRLSLGLKRPIISKATPDFLLAGNLATIEGMNLDREGTIEASWRQDKKKVTKRLETTSWEPTRILVTLPTGTTRSLELVVENANGTSVPLKINVSQSPPSGAVKIPDLVGDHLSMLLDKNDFPHILVFNKNPQHLTYAWWNGFSFQHVNLEATTDPIGTVSVPADVGKLISDFVQENDKKGKDALSNADLEAKITEILNEKAPLPDPSAQVIPSSGHFPNLVREANGTMQIICYDFLSQSLLRGRGHSGGESWLFQVMSPPGEKAAFFSDVSTKRDGTIGVAYMVSKPQGVRYIEGSEAPVWADQGEVGVSVRLTYDQQDRPHLAYLDYGSHSLKYSTLGVNGFVPESVDTDGWVGDTPAIAIDEKGSVQISYCLRDKAGLIATGLRIASKVDGAWERTDVDIGPGIGSQSQLVTGPDSRLRVVYLDQKGSAIRVATRQPDGKWTIVAHERPGVVARLEPASLDVEVDSKGRIWAAFWSGDPLGFRFENLESTLPPGDQPESPVASPSPR